MGSSRGKKEEKTLKKSADADMAAIVEDPLIVARRNNILGFNKQVAAGTDVSQMDALKPYLSLYNGAISDQQADRKSNGILNLAMNGDGAKGAGQAYEIYLKNKRQQDAAGMLENAYNQTSADFNNDSFRIGQMSDSRNMGKASLSQNAYESFAKRQAAKPGIFDRIMQVGQLAVGGIGAWKGCWVAEAVYGVNDPRTHLVRAWLNFEFIKTRLGRIVMAFYITFGQAIAKQVTKHGFLRRLVKPLFDKALARSIAWVERREVNGEYH